MRLKLQRLGILALVLFCTRRRQRDKPIGKRRRMQVATRRVGFSVAFGMRARKCADLSGRHPAQRTSSLLGEPQLDSNIFLLLHSVAHHMICMPETALWGSSWTLLGNECRTASLVVFHVGRDLVHEPSHLGLHCLHIVSESKLPGILCCKALFCRLRYSACPRWWG